MFTKAVVATLVELSLILCVVAVVSPANDACALENKRPFIVTSLPAVIAPVTFKSLPKDRLPFIEASAPNKRRAFNDASPFIMVCFATIKRLFNEASPWLINFPPA